MEVCMKSTMSMLISGFMISGLFLSQSLAQSFVSSFSPIDSNGIGALPSHHDWSLQSTIQIDTAGGKLGWSGRITGQKLTQTETRMGFISVVQPFPLLPKLTQHTLELTYSTRGDSVDVTYGTGMQIPVYDSNINAWTVSQPRTRIEIPATVSYNLYQEGNWVASGSLDYSVMFTYDPIRGVNTADYPNSVTPVYLTVGSLQPTSYASLGTVAAPSGAVFSIQSKEFVFLPEPWEYGLATTGGLVVFALLRRRSAFLRPAPKTHTE